MNRREFCLSLGATALGGTVAAWRRVPAEAVRDQLVVRDRFRAKLIYPEPLSERLAFLPVSEQVKRLREELSELSERFDALVVNERRNLSPEFAARLEAASSHVGLDLYWPGRFSWKPFSLMELESDMQDGLFFLVSPQESVSSSRGIIVCDPSRCRWRTFLYRERENPFIPGEWHVRNENLRTARCLDRMQKQQPFIV